MSPLIPRGISFLLHQKPYVWNLYVCIHVEANKVEQGRQISVIELHAGVTCTLYTDICCRLSHWKF